jgi:DNA-binding beta-propeller fold protein YncE
VLKIDAGGRFTTLAGTGRKGDGGDGGPASKAEFNGPHNLAVAPNGDVYVADTWNCRVRKIDARTGVITTLAGTGVKGFSGDGGLADKAQFGGIYCATLSPDGRTLYLADLDNRRIRAVDLATKVVRTVAGNGQKGVPPDRAKATDAPLVDPRAVAADARGNVYVLERGGHALRVVAPDGTIRTVVGTGQKGLSGNGGDGRRATLSGPKHLCVDRAGDVIIADSDNHCVRKYSPKDGRIVRVAGTGKAGAAGVGGPPEQVELNQPHGVAVRADGTLYIVDSMNHRVLKLVP